MAMRKRNISSGEAKEFSSKTPTTSLQAGSVAGIPGDDGASRNIDHNHRPSDSGRSLSWKRVRETVFPVYGHELTKFLLIGSIKFFIIAALVLTRDTKDTLVVTQCGAEAIAFLKIYGVLPAATAYIALYSKLSNLFGKKALFYVTCIPFFVFFGIFDFLIYPHAAMLHPSLNTVQKLLGVVPGSSGGLTIFANILSNWTSALFYILAEIYSSVSVGLLFWQFANDVVPVDQAKRFYPLFAQMSGLAPVVAGQYVVRYTSQAANFQSSMHRLTAAITLSGIMICFFYRTCTSYIERTEGKKLNESQPSSTKKKKVKPSMMESAKFLANSQYLRLIATLVLGYGLSINFTEIMWKSLVKRQYPNALDYQRFMGNFSTVVGAATCIVIFFGVHVIRILGWRVGAMATPGIMSIIAVPFFASILMGLDSPARLQTAVVCGTILSLVSKTAKYALFDPTTQMSYIPLDDESKVKGKAAIDVLGSRIGKSGGSLIQQGLVILFGNIIQAAPVVSVIYYGVLLTWLGAANKLSGLFHAQTEMGKADQHDEQQQQQEQQHLKAK
jgi:AAA family ATP:ADP antiporter